MKKIASVGLGVCLSALVSGCAGFGPAAHQVPGFLYNETKVPAWDLNVNTSGDSSAKVGKAMCKSILGLVAIDDCSIEAAKKNGGITKVTSVDFEVKNILGIYAEYTTKVIGN